MATTFNTTPSTTRIRGARLLLSADYVIKITLRQSMWSRLPSWHLALLDRSMFLFSKRHTSDTIQAQIVYRLVVDNPTNDQLLLDIRTVVFLAFELRKWKNRLRCNVTIANVITTQQTSVILIIVVYNASNLTQRETALGTTMERCPLAMSTVLKPRSSMTATLPTIWRIVDSSKRQRRQRRH